MMTSLQQRLAQKVHTALQTAYQAGQLGQLSEIPAVGEITIQRPKQPELGDYATPVAMALAKPSRLAPLVLASAIATHLADDDLIVEVAKPGFINLRLSERFLVAELEAILQRRDQYGQTSPDKPERILLEFVSANPTGPLHVGHGRWAAIGSTLKRTLEFAGYDVDSEFYINDAGNQMQLLGASLGARYRQALGEAVEMPERGYMGSALRELAAQLVAEVGDTRRSAPLDWFTAYAEGALLKQQKETLRTFRTEFERWYSERTLHTEHAVEETLAELEERGMLYRATRSRQEESGDITHRSARVQPSVAALEDEEGGGEALYFKSADFGDEMDRVVKRADGRLTYLSADIAYHRDKYNRGYDRLINIWGADHHGYIPRLKASVQALGHPESSLEILLGQLVRLFRTNPDGQKEEVRMSKRTGDIVTVNDLIDEVGVDAARWFLLSQSLNTGVNFDLDLAKTEAFNNPVFYVQYAHARCCSILRKAVERDMPPPEHFQFLKPDGTSWLESPQEQALIRRLIAAPDEFRFSALERTPQRLTQYAYELASDLSQFYEHCPILPPLAESVEPERRFARLGLVVATRQVLANTLYLLGIEPRESM